MMQGQRAHDAATKCMVQCKPVQTCAWCSANLRKPVHNAVAEDSSDDEEVWEEIMPGRKPKVPSPPEVHLQPLMPLPDHGTAEGHSTAPASPSAAAAKAIRGASPESGFAGGGARGRALAPQGGAAPVQQPQDEPVQGEATSPPHSPATPQTSHAHRATSVSFGVDEQLSDDPPRGHSHMHGRLNGASSGVGREGDVSLGGGTGRTSLLNGSHGREVTGGISSLWLQGDPPVLVKEALLPPACEFANLRTVVNKIQALMAADDFNAVGPQLAPLRADWEGAVADKFIRDASRRAKLAKQAMAKNKSSGAAVEETPEEEEDIPKEVPAEAAVWLLLVAGRCAMAGRRMESAKAFMHTAK
ncbi:hypothetical protein DUNSADRAFT_8754 [Dunaliella salina]|uniref:Uncharacterized protein n=1 Tax=Dunaliella salina TaxID=3046 RepID=A0ABQ7GIX4_DUNSA|nr:hypothetical protein DUNSADRAFT_8754 [Dunaliella salina]|eukprot:KAF5834546.1 hypothetical protein DUNSADRAFT_8754 [Dunaliella salina]